MRTNKLNTRNVFVSDRADFGRPLPASCSSTVEHDRQTLRFESSGFVQRLTEQTHASEYTVNVVITRSDWLSHR